MTEDKGFDTMVSNKYDIYVSNYLHQAKNTIFDLFL